MTHAQRDRIEAVLSALWSDVEWELRKRFGDAALTVSFRCYWCDASDAPFVIRLGEVEGECIDVDGFTVDHAMQRFRGFGLAMVKTRILMGSKS